MDIFLIQQVKNQLALGSYQVPILLYANKQKDKVWLFVEMKFKMTRC